MCPRRRKPTQERTQTSKKQGETSPGEPPALAATSPQQTAAVDVVELDEAVTLLRTSRSTLYRWIRERKLPAMKAGRQWRFRRGDLDRFLTGASPRPALPVSPEPLVEQLSKALLESGIRPAEISRSGDTDPLHYALDLMLHLALQRNASDIHISALVEGGVTRGVVRLRRDGVLCREADFDSRLLPHLVERLKTLAGCDVLDLTHPQDARMRWMCGETDAHDLRACFLPTALGTSVTIRILPLEFALPDLGAVGFAPQDLKRLEQALCLPNGILLITGPTGSGKTTVGYAALKRLARTELKVMSVEDPVEVIIPGVDQAAVRSTEGLTFARLLRSVMRSDPDVVLVGEIRDRETLEMICAVALTGHLVLTTLHTTEAAQVFVRMRDIGLEPFLAADTVRFVESQRLIRVLCRECARPHPPSGSELLWARQALLECGLNEDDLGREFKESVGCPRCGGMGYQGRCLIAETLTMTPDLARAVRERAAVGELRRLAIAQGMTTLAADAARKAYTGVTSLSEAYRVAGPISP